MNGNRHADPAQRNKRQKESLLRPWVVHQSLPILQPGTDSVPFKRRGTLVSGLMLMAIPPLDKDVRLTSGPSRDISTQLNSFLPLVEF
ncbi:hypothetical protein TNIN_322421 [Trichonephila inaurata madagascariensis]|uniref:Uncharacterized protein n=1 Tax=Trichonephila inaurata madagascariensis TaxID=2747483 RepID=A0A8X6IB67_9ARAC|nr:hypothetical protein TNIN_322421 [Trichonephila inaurata madagascariensis]